MHQHYQCLVSSHSRTQMHSPLRTVTKVLFVYTYATHMSHTQFQRLCLLPHLVISFLDACRFTILIACSRRTYKIFETSSPLGSIREDVQKPLHSIQHLIKQHSAHLVVTPPCALLSLYSTLSSQRID